MRFPIAAVAAALAELCLGGPASSMERATRFNDLNYISNPMPAADAIPGLRRRDEGEEEQGRMIEAPNATVGYFEQLRDHKNASAGTFTQRYWYSAEHYKNNGSPIVLSAGDLVSGGQNSWFTHNSTLPGQYAQAIGGAAIVLEHRYTDGSSPVDELTGEGLKHLTVENAVEDIVYFANNVDLPFDPTHSSRPSNAPWILTGCGWAGSLTAWTSRRSPDTFWAYHASSAPVHAFRNFWQFFDPIEKAMPRNCSADYKRVVAHVDRTFRNGSAEERQQLKQLFGFGALEYDDDFASSIVLGLSFWLIKRPRDEFSPLFQMCDYIENQWPGSNATVPGVAGVGEKRAIQGYAKWSREMLIPGYCALSGLWNETDVTTVACFNMHDTLNPVYHDKRVNNFVNRINTWLRCDGPFENWVAWGPGASESGLIPEKYDSESWRRQCDAYFPNTTYGLKLNRTADDFNAITGGWDVANSKRIIWTNGEHDPMLEASVSSHWRPGGPLQSTNDAPVWVIPNGTICADRVVAYAEGNPEIEQVMNDAIAQIKGWVEDYYLQRGGRTEGTAT